VRCDPSCVTALKYCDSYCQLVLIGGLKILRILELGQHENLTRRGNFFNFPLGRHPFMVGRKSAFETPVALVLIEIRASKINHDPEGVIGLSSYLKFYVTSRPYGRCSLLRF
jgi:hypothetical protein